MTDDERRVIEGMEPEARAAVATALGPFAPHTEQRLAREVLRQAARAAASESALAVIRKGVRVLADDAQQSLEYGEKEVGGLNDLQARRIGLGLNKLNGAYAKALRELLPKEGA